MRPSLASVLVSLALTLPGAALGQAAADSAGAAVAGAPVRSDEEVHVTALRYAPAVRGCYEREGLRRDPTLDGTLTVALTVLPDGAVREVTVDTAGVRGNGMREVAQCVAAAAATWRFEKGAYAIERAELPFHCAPATKESGDSSATGASQARTP